MKKWLALPLMLLLVACSEQEETHFEKADAAVEQAAENEAVTNVNIVGEENVAGTDSVIYVFEGEKESGEQLYYVSLVESQEDGYTAIETLDIRTPQAADVFTGEYIAAQFLTPNAELELAPYQTLITLTTGDVLLVEFL